MVGLTPHAVGTLWLIPALPLAGAAITLFFGNRLGKWAGVLATVAVGLVLRGGACRRAQPA